MDETTYNRFGAQSSPSALSGWFGTMLIAAAWLLLTASPLLAQIYDTNGAFVQTFAGSGLTGLVDGVGQQTMFSNPVNLCADTGGNIFVLDLGNSCVRKISPDSTVSVFAGTGTNAPPGYGTNVILFGLGSAMTIDHSNRIWVIAGGNYNLTSIDPSGLVTQTTNTTGGVTFGLCSDSKNNLYYTTGQKVYRLNTNGTTEVFAGSGNEGDIDGNGIFCSFSVPRPIACDASDNLYLWEYASYFIRKITPNRDVITYAGHTYNPSGRNIDGFYTNSDFMFVGQICPDPSGGILLACGNSVRKITLTTNAITVAGNFNATGYNNGVGSNALFYGASGICTADGTIYVSEVNNPRIRAITNNPVAQVVSPNLEVGLFPGISINGLVGRSYRIDSSVDAQQWNAEATMILNQTPYLWIDQAGLGQKKFYRAVLMP